MYIHQKWIEPEALNQIRKWAASGLSQAQIAHNIGIHATSLIRWKKKYPEFAQALQQGQDVADALVEEALFRRGIGYTVEETSERPDGKNGISKITKTRHIPGNPKAQIYWLENRKPAQWGKPSLKEEQDRMTEGMRKFLAFVQQPEENL